MSEVFRKVARTISNAVGSPISFLLAVMIVITWLITGPVFKFSDTWQLVINTGTTIVTFLMVFLIQNSQNRDARAMQLKLDELISAVVGARNELVNLEAMPDDRLMALQAEFEKLANDYGVEAEHIRHVEKVLTERKEGKNGPADAENTLRK